MLSDRHEPRSRINSKIEQKHRLQFKTKKVTNEIMEISNKTEASNTNSKITI